MASGSHDAFLPAGRLERATARKLPGADFRVIADAGHMLPAEAPDAVAAAVASAAT